MQRVTHRRIFLLPFLGSVLASCGGGEPTGPAGKVDGPATPRMILSNPLFDPDIQNILLEGGCAAGGCHGAPQGQAGLKLDADVRMNYVNLVNVPAQQQAGFLLVKPTDATNSYVVIKLEDRQNVGGPMPVGEPLDSIDLMNIRNWIDNGAPMD